MQMHGPNPHLDQLPIGSGAVDTFIGEPTMIGPGHGSAHSRITALRLQAEGAPVIVIDPTEENRRAVRAYQRAGFESTRCLQIRKVPRF
jgi:aminoglycoside 6'-N-acetyltransferase